MTENLQSYDRILCPLDLSEHSKTAVELASVLARESNALLEFIFVSPLWFPEEAMFGSDYTRVESQSNQTELEKIRPCDSKVKFKHTLVNGNPGPEIVKASKGCDLIVMATHGHGALMRLLIGSVAKYVLRHAKCQVIVIKGINVKSEKQEKALEQGNVHHFVTRYMHHIDPVREDNNMTDVVVELDRAGQTVAPVVDASGQCIGILTKTDIEQFLELQHRYDENDPTVIPEIFETDKFGHVCSENASFTQVCRHMSQPVVTVTNSASIETANQLFAENPEIHHLVVLDESERPIGILDSNLVGKITT